MSSPRILISGAGIAGSVTAYWLGKSGLQVTVIERTPSLRTAGQGIDMEGPAIPIIQKMGLEEDIRAKTTGENGLAFVYEDDEVFATFDVGDKRTDAGFTSDIEIMRGDLCDILYRAANEFENVEFWFDCKVEELRQTGKVVNVVLSDGSEAEFDIVIAADGFRSGIRKLIFDAEENKTCVESQGSWVAYFTIPREEQDSPRSRGYNAPGGRFIMIRPRDEKVSSGYLVLSNDAKALRESSRSGMQAQKAALAELFADAGWEATRVIAGMKDTEDFYLQEVANIKLNMTGWSRGRCALVGDAAYCSFTGTGTTLAILGGYMLAGEIVKSPGEPTKAFKAYEDNLRGYVTKATKAPFAGPQLFVPQTRLGIWILRTIVWLVYWSGILSWVGGFSMPKFDLPDYQFDKSSP